MTKAGKMIMRAGVCRESENGPYRVIVCQWINVSDGGKPTGAFFMPETYPTKDEAEAGLAGSVLPELRKKMKAMRKSLPVLDFRSGRLKPEQMNDIEQDKCRILSRSRAKS